MTRSVKSLIKSGAISTRAYNETLAKTRSQKAKMAPFDQDTGNTGGNSSRGLVGKSEINKPRFQKTPGKFKPSRGAGVKNAGAVPDRNAINQRNGKMFPAGKSMSGKSGFVKPARVR